MSIRSSQRLCACQDWQPCSLRAAGLRWVSGPELVWSWVGHPPAPVVWTAPIAPELLATPLMEPGGRRLDRSARNVGFERERVAIESPCGDGRCR